MTINVSVTGFPFGVKTGLKLTISDGVLSQVLASSVDVRCQHLLHDSPPTLIRLISS